MRALHRPFEVAPPSASDADPMKVDTDKWRLDALTIPPNNKRNILIGFPLQPEHARKYAQEKALEQVLQEKVIGPALTNLRATMAGQAPPSEKFYCVDTVRDADIANKGDQGMVGGLGVFATEAALQEEDFIFLGFYAGEHLYTPADWEAYIQKYDKDKDRLRAESYLADAHSPGATAVEGRPNTMIIAGSGGGNDMARINAPVKDGYKTVRYAQGSKRRSWKKIDEARVSAVLVNITQTMRDQDRGGMTAIPGLAIVAYAPALRTALVSGKRDRVQFLLNYGQQQINRDMNGKSSAHNPDDVAPPQFEVVTQLRQRAEMT
jgi:hypothetical protein